MGLFCAKIISHNFGPCQGPGKKTPRSRGLKFPACLGVVLWYDLFTEARKEPEMNKPVLTLTPATGANISPDIRREYSMWACDHDIDATEWIATGSTKSREGQYHVSIVGECLRDYWAA